MRYDVHTTIKKVGEDYERMKFNTAIAQMMTLVNQLYQKGSVTRGEMRVLIQLLNPGCAAHHRGDQRAAR